MNLPKTIPKCRGKGGRAITANGILNVKTFGKTSWTDKISGQEKQKYGPMYLNFKENCLKNFNETHMYGPGENNNFQHIKIDENTRSALSENKKTFLESLCIHRHLIFYIFIFEVFF